MPDGGERAIETLALRASMSVPGLMAPLKYRGRKLVDGGLVDNVPIREVRERCGAQVVIAVNVGSPLLKPGDINGLLSVLSRPRPRPDASARRCTSTMFA